MKTPQTRTGWSRAAVITTANTMPLRPPIEIVAFVTSAPAEQATGGNTSHDTDRRCRTRPAGGAVTGAGTSALSVGYPSAFPTLNRGHDVHSVFKEFAPDLCHKK